MHAQWKSWNTIQLQYSKPALPKQHNPPLDLIVTILLKIWKDEKIVKMQYRNARIIRILIKKINKERINKLNFIPKMSKTIKLILEKASTLLNISSSTSKLTVSCSQVSDFYALPKRTNFLYHFMWFHSFQMFQSILQ